MTGNPFVWFWVAMIAGSIAWYSYLLFHVGVKGGFDILRMTRAISRPPRSEPAQDESP